MGRIIHCSDLVLRINDSHEQEIGNLTEWIIQSTEYRPVKPDSCDIRDELDSNQKVMVIVMIWTFFIIVSIFYCYFCEQKLFPGQKLFDTCLVDRTGFLNDGRCPNQDCNLTNRLLRFPVFKKPFQSNRHNEEKDRLIWSSSTSTPTDEPLSFGDFRRLPDTRDEDNQEYYLKKRVL